MHKIGNNIVVKFLVIVLGLTSFACMPKQDKEPRIRIVDLQGKSRSVVTRAPILNNQALMMQRAAANQGYAPQDGQGNAIDPNQGQPIENLNYGQASSEIIQQTLQPTQNAPQGANPIVAIDNNAKRPEIDNSIEYDLSDAPEVEKPAAKPVANKARTTAKQPKKKFIISNNKRKGLFVQVGSFASASNAKKTLETMQKFHPGRIEKVAGKPVLYRVLLGPFTSKTKANMLVTKIENSGHDAVLMRNR